MHRNISYGFFTGFLFWELLCFYETSPTGNICSVRRFLLKGFEDRAATILLTDSRHSTWIVDVEYFRYCLISFPRRRANLSWTDRKSWGLRSLITITENIHFTQLGNGRYSDNSGRLHNHEDDFYPLSWNQHLFWVSGTKEGIPHDYHQMAQRFKSTCYVTKPTP